MRVGLVSYVMYRRERRLRAMALAQKAGATAVEDPEPWKPPTPAGTWRTARECWLRGAAHPTATHILVLQDDVVICKDFRAAAVRALEVRRWNVVTFFSRRAEVEKADARGEHWAELPEFLMGQAVALPKQWALPFVNWADEFCPAELGDDARLGRWLKNSSAKAWATVPSLVQHDRGMKSLMKGRGAREARIFAFGGADQIDWTRGA